MKRIYYSVPVALLLMLSLLGACKKSSGINNSIVGTWGLVNLTDSINIPLFVYDSTNPNPKLIEITFNSNHTYHSQDNISYTSDDGTYSTILTDTLISLSTQPNSTPDTSAYVVTGNTLTTISISTSNGIYRYAKQILTRE